MRTHQACTTAFVVWMGCSVVAHNGSTQDKTSKTEQETLLREQIQQHRRNILKALTRIRDQMVAKTPPATSAAPSSTQVEAKAPSPSSWIPIARTCPTNDIHHHYQNDDGGLMALELQESRLLMEESEGEPFAGMMLEVYHSGWWQQQPPQKEQSGWTTTKYVLIEPLELELGRFPQHEFDFAYWPVVGNQQQQPQQLWKPSSVELLPSPQQPQQQQLLNFQAQLALITESTWWKWWFVFMGFSKQRQRRRRYRYERMGEHAFAGGSHGQVWRGRRVCPKEEQEKETFQRKDGHQKRRRGDCQEPLILKRLKVELGDEMLEAGLREIYFGNILNQHGINNNNEDGTTHDYFTVYLDHFFRKSSSRDLWIVFRDAGRSLRSYLYTPVQTGNFVMYQNSWFWTRLRMSNANKTMDNYSNDESQQNEEESVATAVDLNNQPKTKKGFRRESSSSSSRPRNSRRNGGEKDETMTPVVGRMLMREVLKQILSAAARLHYQGIVHRDIKPSNVLCKADIDLENVFDLLQLDNANVHCVLGDFSSAWDSFADQNLYSDGPSAMEQTEEYAPPEARLGPSWVPFHEDKPESYDSWSIGVLALELLLGTPNVFSVDQRTTAVLTNRMKQRGASDQEIRRALYLAALSQFCIYVPVGETYSKHWPMRHGDPLHNTAMVKKSCTIADFHSALRARDPLGIGFDSAADTLLHLIWKLLAWDPLERITAAQALGHPYFTVIDVEQQALVPTKDNALESVMLDARMDIGTTEPNLNFTCPKCKRRFGDWRSCRTHATSRRHAKFCTYNRTEMPSCLNAHSLLPAHPLSGYCDIQGRRRTIEDFHSIHLHPSHQYYGVFDGHMGNLASKYAASVFYHEVQAGLGNHIATDDRAGWKCEVEQTMKDIFEKVHQNLLRAVTNRAVAAMDQSGTTATFVYVTEEALIVASVGDSRAIVSSMDENRELKALQLTKDHVASDPSEKELVESRGGRVDPGEQVARVEGKLAITRSLGDAALARYLSREPHVVAMTKKELYDNVCGELSFPCFVVLASDGLWDVMSNQEVIDMVAEEIESFEDIEAEDENDDDDWEELGVFQKAAERLTHEAYVRGSTDNIGVCVVAII